MSRFSILCLLLSATAHAADPQPVSFHFDVNPLLSDRCYTCHGPDKESLEADLRLDRADGIASVVTAGNTEASELYRRITSSDPDERMPPPDSGLLLTPAETDVLRRWIEQGAESTGHWAFAPPRKVPAPQEEGTTWARNEIDRFVLRRLRDAGLSPAAEASRERLIRRVTFDLTGLPPTIEEVDAFLADDSAEAYERVVDRLLASEHYGERMAGEWLDVARYSDTYGYQVDRDRFVWPWRDWVIRAFNRNLPYDQFITEQLAGDLLPAATDDQILATTFCRLHPQKVEGGSTPEEFRIEYVSDRTQTVATAFLGLTLECARCHEHKYDPITQAEYYQLTAFFDNIDEAGLYSYFTQSVPTPTLVLADEPTKEQLAGLRADVTSAEQRLAEIAAEQRASFDRWLETARGKSGEQAPTELAPGEIAHLDFEGEIAAPNTATAGPVGQAVRLTGDDAVPLEVGNFHRFEPFSVALWMNTPDHKERAVVYHRSRAWTDAGSRGYELLIEDGRLSAALIHFWPGNAIRVRTTRPIAVGEWLHVAVTYDGSSRAEGLRIFINGEMAPVDIIRDELHKEITGGGGDNITIGERMRDRGFTGGMVDEFRVFTRRLTPLEVSHLYQGNRLTELLGKPVGQLDDAERAQLFEYHLSTANSDYEGQLTETKRAREALANAQNAAQEIMVMRELDKPRQTFLLQRGRYDARGEPVLAQTPAAFPPFPEDAPQNRLGLARWLTSDEQPLTARVTINRYWQMVFGAGLVRTPEDFGSQGQSPTHPDLLDWLARDFADRGWDVKRLLKQMVMSSTYRQSSHVSEETVGTDPENRLWSRASSYRLPAEMLRDAALATSGLLVERIGGPPAKPYEVEVSFKPTKPDTGEGLFRRSLYTYWKRTGPAPVMMTLDASKRDVCRVRRERTSSPLQAFVMMNGPQFVEASRLLAEHLMREHGEDNATLLTDMFRRLTSRRPSEPEIAILTQLAETQQARFAAAPEQASALLKIGASPHSESLDAVRLAALTVVANTILNFDESITRR